MAECGATARNGDFTNVGTGGSSVPLGPCFSFSTAGGMITAVGQASLNPLFIPGYWVEMVDPARTATGISFTISVPQTGVGYLPGHGPGDPDPIRTIPLTILFDDGTDPVIPVIESCTVHPPVGMFPAKTITPVLNAIDATQALRVGVSPVPASNSDPTVIDVVMSFPDTVGARMAVLTLSPIDAPSVMVPFVWECIDVGPSPSPDVTPPIECLGEGVYTMDIVRRPSALGPGGPFLPSDDIDVLGGNWSRKFGTSSAGVTFAADADCCASIEAMKDMAVLELELWRESAQTNKLVWAGPVLDLLDNRDGTFLLTAADQSYYPMSERQARARSWVATDLATIFAEAITDALAEDNPGIHLTTTPTGVVGDRSIAGGDAKQLGQFLDEIARTAIDWTVVGREWFVGGQQIDRASVLPIQLHDEHFATPPKIRLSRSAMGTRQVVRGNGVVGTYGEAREDGVIIEKVTDENAIIDQVSADAAARTLWDRNHEAVTVIDGNSEAKLDPDSEVDIQTLIPGVGINVQLGDCLTYAGLMRLEGVSVDFGETEDVKITLQPVGTGALA